MITITPRLASLTYDQAEWQFHNGLVTYEEWQAYRHVWRRSVPRFSNIAYEHDNCHCEENQP